jgi:hypothetical protein
MLSPAALQIPVRKAQTAHIGATLKATKGDVARLHGFEVPARVYREFLTYDPKPGLAAITVPVLAVTPAGRPP